MKKLFLIFFLLFPLVAFSQTQVITGTLTFTNVPTNGEVFSINGHQREWTNSVNQANNQILTNLTIIGSASNLFSAYVSYPETIPYLIVLQTSPTNIQFQTLASTSPALVFSTNWIGGGAAPSWWVSWSYATNYLTNETVVRVPTNGISNFERTNVENGIVQYLDDLGATNKFSYQAPMFSEFLGTNFGQVLTNYASNIVLTASNAVLNYASNITVTSSNAVITWSSNYTDLNVTAGSNFTLFASNYLWTLINGFGAQTAWQDSGKDVYLTNDWNQLRIEAQTDFGSIGGITEFFASDGSTPWLYNDGGMNTIAYDRNNVARIEVDDPTGNAPGNTYIRGEAGTSLGNNGPNIGGGPQIGAGIAVSAVDGTLFASRPIVMQNVTLPAVCIGTVTNFATVNIPSDATYNSFTIPGDCLTNNGDGLVRTIGIKFVGAGTYSLAVEFQGNNIFQSGSITSLSAGFLSIRCEVDVFSGGVFSWNSSATGSQLSTNTFANVGTATLSTGGGNPTNFLVNIISQLGTDDTWIYSDRTVLMPSGMWNALP